MPIIDPAIAPSPRREAFRNHYHDKTRVNMSFHDTLQQPVRPAGVVPDGAEQPAPARMRTDPDSADRRGASCIRLARAIRRANRAGANARPRPHANARDKGSLQNRAGETVNRTEEPQRPMPIIDPAIALSTRREAFCRHYTASGNAADAARQGHARAKRALARHRESREALEAQEGFDAAAHEEAARRLAATVEERTRLPVSFEPPPPPPANDLPRPLADDPPEETYEDCPWAPDGGGGGEDRIDDDRADDAEHGWLHQRRYDYDEIYDPWAPEEVEERRLSRLECEERGDDWSRPATGNSPPNHDIA